MSAMIAVPQKIINDRKWKILAKVRRLYSKLVKTERLIFVFIQSINTINYLYLIIMSVMKFVILCIERLQDFSISTGEFKVIIIAYVLVFLYCLFDSIYPIIK